MESTNTQPSCRWNESQVNKAIRCQGARTHLVRLCCRVLACSSHSSIGSSCDERTLDTYSYSLYRSCCGISRDMFGDRMVKHGRGRKDGCFEGKPSMYLRIDSPAMTFECGVDYRRQSHLILSQPPQHCSRRPRSPWVKTWAVMVLNSAPCTADNVLKSKIKGLNRELNSGPRAICYVI